MADDAEPLRELARAHQTRTSHAATIRAAGEFAYGSIVHAIGAMKLLRQMEFEEISFATPAANSP